VRVLASYYKTPSNRTITLGPQLSIPTVSTVATTPYVRPRASFTSQTEYDAAVEVDFTQFVNQVSRTLYIVTTNGFAGGTPSIWEIIAPDFSGTTYKSSWGLVPGNEYHWNAHGYEGYLGDLLPVAVPVDGQLLASATRGGTVSAP
jgi:hypothetical protein